MSNRWMSFRPGLSVWALALSVGLGLSAPSSARADAYQPQHRPYAAISSGAAHSCAVKSDGSVACWGSNSFGQVGDGGNGSNNERHAAAAIPGFGAGGPTAVGVAAGDTHSCALVHDGRVFCWGENAVGQLGTGSYAASADPVQVNGIGGGSPAAISLTAGGTHTCAVLADGTVKCWGSNSQGQIGAPAAGTLGCSFPVSGAALSCNAPVTVTGVAGVVSVTAGAEHTCALDTQGKVWCWGAGNEGQLGDGGTVGSLSYRTSPQAVVGISGTNLAVAVSAGASHTSALTEVISITTPASRVYCWGTNGRGQLGNGTSGTTNSSSSPVQVSSLGNVKDLSASGDHTCALRADGTVSCWGDNSDGAIGNGVWASGVLDPRTLSSSPECAAGSSAGCSMQTTPAAVTSLNGARSISAGGFHTCAVLDEGTVSCWGSDQHGQLGDATTNFAHKPNGGTLLSSLSGVVNGPQIAVGSMHSCAVRADGRAKCWGYSTTGAIGDGFRVERDSAVTVDELISVYPINTDGPMTNATQLCAGSDHSCALFSDGTIECWGDNSLGQLGLGSLSPTYLTEPSWTRAVTGISHTAVAITCGYYHTCAQLADGTAKCWGYNYNGQLGNGGSLSTTPVTTPTTVIAAGGGVSSGFRSLAAGPYHTCGVLASGLVQCWGWDQYGQIGLGTTAPARSAPLIPTLAGGLTARSMGLGYMHSCAVMSNGTAQCWGNNASSQLGNPAAGSPSTPTAVSSASGMSGVVGVTAGYTHTCALSATGAAWCWGTNSNGLGNGNTTATTPQSLSTLSGVASLSSSNRSTCALLSGGTAACWGLGTNGQIGNGLPNNQSYPTAVLNFPAP
jgi:alpha-tubulin suppressor-like RCC1 family protein